MSRVKSARAPAGGRRQSVRAVEMGALVLRALGKLGGHAALSELAASVALPPSKAHRYLKALIATGFVEHDAGAGRYSLGVESLLLGLRSLATIDVVGVAAPHLAHLCAELDETILLSVWAQHGATVVHVREPARRITVVTRLGSVLPLLSSATGLVFAAFLPAAAKQAAAAPDGRLPEIRAGGTACVQSLLFPGIDAIAAPIFDAAGQVAAVVTVLGPTTSFSVATDGRTARALRKTAAAVSARLGHAP